MKALIDYIEQMLFAPLAAERFAKGLLAKIAILRHNADIYAISPYADVLCYGRNARAVTYKGFSIIYTIHGSYALIHRIVHGSLIKN